MLCIDIIERVDPVRLHEVDGENDAAAGPGDGIGPGNGSQLVDKPDRDGDIADTDDAPAH